MKEDFTASIHHSQPSDERSEGMHQGNKNEEGGLARDKAHHEHPHRHHDGIPQPLPTTTLLGVKIAIPLHASTAFINTVKQRVKGPPLDGFKVARYHRE